MNQALLQTYFGSPTPPASVPNPVLYQNHYVANQGPFRTIGLRFDERIGLTPDPAQIAAARGPTIWGAGFSIASIVDGTTNTMLFSENGIGSLSPNDLANEPSWHDGQPSWGLEALHPPNWWKLNRDPATWDAASFHPGGVVVGFCDGSVRFVKDTVACWAFSPPGQDEADGLPVGATPAPPPTQPSNHSQYGLVLGPDCRLGLRQKLATRDGGEVVGVNEF